MTRVNAADLELNSFGTEAVLSHIFSYFHTGKVWVLIIKCLKEGVNRGLPLTVEGLEYGFLTVDG